MQQSDLIAAAQANANLIAAAMFVVVLCGQIVTWLRQGKGDGARMAAAAAAQTAAVKELTAANDRVATALGSLESWARTHDLADARFQEKTISITGQLTDAVTRLTNMQETMRREITNIVLRMAPDGVVEVPPSSRRKR